jgi:hypothetical protein
LAPLGFVAGVLCTLALIVLLLPWLRTIPRLTSLPQLPWQAGLGALVVMCLIVGLHAWSAGPVAPAPGGTDVTASGIPVAGGADSSASAWADVAGALQSGGAAPGSSPAGSKPAAQSMNAAVASLESRLAANGGSNDDWELLAKSYEFLNRPQDAARARAHQLPAPQAGSSGAAAPAGASLSGEVTLAGALRGKATSGATLFIIAKSVADPGAPVAVLRSAVHDWPVRFHLDDSQAMLPGRNLSSAGRVTVEARVSLTGQPLAATGDLQGSAGPLDPARHPAVSIVIDKVLP